MGHGLRWIKYTAAILLGWAILWPALAETTRITGRELTQLASTSSDTGAVEPLVAGRTFGVSFICPEDGLSALEFRVATYQRINPARLVLLLYKVPPGLKVNPDPAARVPIRRVVYRCRWTERLGPGQVRVQPGQGQRSGQVLRRVDQPGNKGFPVRGLGYGQGLGFALLAGLYRWRKLAPGSGVAPFRGLRQGRDHVFQMVADGPCPGRGPGIGVAQKVVKACSVRMGSSSGPRPRQRCSRAGLCPAVLVCKISVVVIAPAIKGAFLVKPTRREKS